MDTTNQRRLLNLLAAGFLAIGVGGLVWSFGDVRESVEPVRNGTRDVLSGNSVDSVAAGDSAETENSLANLSLPLLDPLYEKPKPPPKPAPAPAPIRKPRPAVAKAPKLDWKLTGTIIEADRSIAIFTDATGKTDIRTIGEEVELAPSGVLVRKIASDNVTLEMSGKTSKLQLEKTFKSAAGGRPDRRNRGRDR